MRQMLLAFLLLSACSSGPPDPGSDGGQNAAACYRPPAGSVFRQPLVAPVAGCAAAAGATGTLDLQTLGWAPAGGLVIIPQAAPAGVPLPVVFVFHGAGGTGAEARARFQLEGSPSGEVIFVYPTAVEGTWDLRPLSADGDTIDRVLHELSARYCIDPARIYVAGFSAGAVFTLWLGCNVPDTFRAMAVVAGTDGRFSKTCCHSSISGLFIHGVDDEFIPISEGQRARNYTLKRDGCDTTPVPDDPRCQAYSCPAPWAVGYCEWDGDHDVPPWSGEEISRFFEL